MKGFFALEKYCFLVEGAKRGVVHNLENGKVYSVDEYVVKLIKKLEDGLEIQTLLKSYQDGVLAEKAAACIKNLTDLKLGHILTNREKVNKIVFEKPAPLEFVWLEITGACNLKCLHCYRVEKKKQNHPKNKMTDKDWVRVMQQSYAIGCKKLQFIGGEPMIISKRLIKLIEISKKIGFEFIEVFTNATLINDSNIAFFGANQINVAVSIYGDQAEIHDKVTRVKGSFEKTISNLKKMVDVGIKTRVGIVAMNINQDNVYDARRFVQNLGIQNVKIDPVRPCGNGKNNQLIPKEILKKYQISKPSFSHCTLPKFQRAQCGHNCFSKNICVTPTGDIIPCIMERNLVLGNVFDGSVSEIIGNEKALKIRNITKDQVKTCKDCEYRYCCFDCRPKAKNSSPTGDLFAKPIDCLYNPYTGKWN
ncbi:MAG: radical SAM protein [Patescibacteria group bacterium]|nr:radical SAM protein [Patescibacteria group bacterium]